MLRRYFLPLLTVGLLATTEAALAQTAPAAAATSTPKDARQAYRKAAKAQRVLSKREQQALDAQARVQAAQAARDAAAAQVPASSTSAGTAWSGWSNDPLPAQPTSAPHRAIGHNVSVAPGMPLNQIGHGVSTDYDGHPLPVARQ